MKRLFSYFTLATVIIFNVSCDNKKENKESSLDQIVYSDFQSQTFNEVTKEVTYEQKDKPNNSISIAREGSIVITYTFKGGIYNSSTPDMIYESEPDAIEAAIKLKSKDLSGKDTKDKWDLVAKEALEDYKKNSGPVVCIMTVKGKNLTPSGDAGIVKSNEKGRYINIGFEVVNISAAPLKDTKDASDSLKVKICTLERLEKIMTNLDGLIFNWFIFKGDKTLKDVKEGELSFNEMKPNELIYGNQSFIKKN